MAIEDDLGLVEILYGLGLRFMQLTYNNQSLLGSGWMEREDSGVTRMGREAIAEMNRVGMAIDLSHAGERTALEAIDLSKRPDQPRQSTLAQRHRPERIENGAESLRGAGRPARTFAWRQWLVCNGSASALISVRTSPTALSAGCAKAAGPA
jgi:hypothetical protein